MNMTQPRSLSIPFAVCCAAVLLFAIMDATMKGLSLSIGLFNALFWRAVAGSRVRSAQQFSDRLREGGLDPALLDSVWKNNLSL